MFLILIIYYEIERQIYRQRDGQKDTERYRTIQKDTERNKTISKERERGPYSDID
jgi:hypothetical protein